MKLLFTIISVVLVLALLIFLLYVSYQAGYAAGDADGWLRCFDEYVAEY